MPNAAPRPDDQSFIEALAGLLIPMGMPPIAARMHGYLLLSRSPLSLDELVAGLDVSKSSASVAARILERYGIVRRLTEPGTRRVRYMVCDRCAGFLAEQALFLGSMGTLLTDWATGHPRDSRATRLKDMGEFHLRLRDAIETVMNEQAPEPAPSRRSGARATAPRNGQRTR